jgi:Uma2 family endonuclease
MVAMGTRHDEYTKFAPTSTKRMPETARELFDALPELPGFRADVIEGNLIVSPVGTPEHGRHAMRLNRALDAIMDEKGWEAWAGNVDVCIEGPREPVEPDFVLAPLDCPLWGTRELRSTALIMVAEVVSHGSAGRDRTEKPLLYATGGIPIYLLIDPIAKSPSVTVYSDIDDGVYRAVNQVALGAPIQLPQPIGVELDTSIFKTVA